MRQFLLFGFVISTFFLADAQEFSKDAWHNGYLVTNDGDTLRGKLMYDMETNVVQLLKNNIIKTFSSHKIFHFEFYDILRRNYRQFYSIPYNVNFNYKIPIIFEVLYEGPLSLLSREAIIQEAVTGNNTGSPYWAGGSYIRDRVAYTFYFLDKDGNMDTYTGKKNDLFEIMSDKSRQVKQFIKENRLNTDEVKDLIRITSFYNSI